MLDVFQQKCLSRILKIRWVVHLKNEEMRKRAGMEPMSCDVKRRRWKMIGPHFLPTSISTDIAIHKVNAHFGYFGYLITNYR